MSSTIRSAPIRLGSRAARAGCISSRLKDWTLASEIDSGEKVGAHGWLFECAGLERVKVVEKVEEVEKVEDVRGGEAKWVIWGAVPLEAFDGETFTVEGRPIPSTRPASASCPWSSAGSGHSSG